MLYSNLAEIFLVPLAISLVVTAGALAALGPTLFDLLAGLAAGAILVALASVGRRLLPSRGGAASS